MVVVVVVVLVSFFNCIKFFMSKSYKDLEIYIEF